MGWLFRENTDNVLTRRSELALPWLAQSWESQAEGQQTCTPLSAAFLKIMLIFHSHYSLRTCKFFPRSLH